MPRKCPALSEDTGFGIRHADNDKAAGFPAAVLFPSFCSISFPSGTFNNLPAGTFCLQLSDCPYAIGTGAIFLSGALASFSASSSLTASNSFGPLSTSWKMMQFGRSSSCGLPFMIRTFFS